MAKEIAKMRDIRIAQSGVRHSLKNREEANKALRVKITPIWTLEKKKRTEELETLTKALVDGRAKVREYQKQLREYKSELKATNRAYDLNANGKIKRGKDMANLRIVGTKDLELARENLIGITHEVQGIVSKARG